MMVTIKILNTAVGNLETRKSRWHYLVYQTTRCVKISIILIREMYYIRTRARPNLLWYYISDVWRALPVNGSSFIRFFSYIESVIKCVSIFINFPGDNHSFTSFMIWPLLSKLKPRGVWKIFTFRYLRTYPWWTLIPIVAACEIGSSNN